MACHAFARPSREIVSRTAEASDRASRALSERRRTPRPGGLQNYRHISVSNSRACPHVTVSRLSGVTCTPHSSLRSPPPPEHSISPPPRALPSLIVVRAHPRQPLRAAAVRLETSYTPSLRRPLAGARGSARAPRPLELPDAHVSPSARSRRSARFQPFLGAALGLFPPLPFCRRRSGEDQRAAERWLVRLGPAAGEALSPAAGPECFPARRSLRDDGPHSPRVASRWPPYRRALGRAPSGPRSQPRGEATGAGARYVSSREPNHRRRGLTHAHRCVTARRDSARRTKDGIEDRTVERARDSSDSTSATM